MNHSGISRRSWFGRLFGGVALAVGAAAAHADMTGNEQPAAEAPVGTACYTFDEQGRLLSVAYDIQPAISTASVEAANET